MRTISALSVLLPVLVAIGCNNQPASPPPPATESRSKLWEKEDRLQKMRQEREDQEDARAIADVEAYGGTDTEKARKISEIKTKRIKQRMAESEQRARKAEEEAAGLR